MWNARLNHWCLPEFRCSMHQTVTKRPFSPPSFPARRKRRGRRRRVRNDHSGTSRRKRRLFPLCSFLPFQTANRICGLGFSMQICGNLSVSLRLTAPLEGEPRGCAPPEVLSIEGQPLSLLRSQHPYPFCPFGTFPPDRGNRPLEGEPRGAHRRKYSELSGAPFSCRKSTIPWPGNGFSFCTIASLH